MGHCENCCYWRRDKLGAGEEQPISGACLEPRMQQTWNTVARDGLGSGWGNPRVLTGERFGCIHFSPRALTPNK